MAIFDKFADSPDRLKIEGQEITIKLIRNGDGTATIKWNIPIIAGCAPEDLIYDGIIVTVSSRPANFITTSPQDGTYYDSDPSFDSDLHTGDKINVASVVGAFYHDTSTTTIVVTDVLDKTPYYVSAYAVDQNGNYHREGVHAYSLATLQAETDKSSPETPAMHDLQVDTPEGLSTKSLTGLITSTSYSMRLDINGECYEWNDLLGSTMQTYEQMVATLNQRIQLLTNPILGPLYPNAGKYMVDIANEKVYQWDGFVNVEQTATFLATDPAVPILGSYWYNTATNVLNVRETLGWAVVSAIIEYPTDPSNQTDGTIWLDKVLESNGDLDTVNTFAWVWEDTTWCKRPTYIQETNPLLPPVLTSGDYWYNEVDGTVNNRNTELKTWVEVDPIVWDTDPNTITDGNYWYETTTEAAFVRIAGMWSAVTNIRYEERNDEGELDSPVASHYWFVPSEQRLFQRTVDNTAWVEINVVIAALDPTSRISCDLWWDITTGIDSLFVWDAVNSEWDAVTSFTQSVDDPAGVPTIEDGSIWYNPTTEVMQSITGLNCADVIYICSAYDPTNLPVGVVWKDTTNSTWFIWDGSEFTSISVIEDDNDPYAVSDGVFWVDIADTDNILLNLRVSGAWELQVYSTSSLAPEVDTYFYDTIDDELLQWNGTTWVEDCGIAKVELLFNREVCFNDLSDVNTDLFSPFNDFDRFGIDLIRFSTCDIGCEQLIEFDNRSTVFTQLSVPIVNFTPVKGKSVNAGGPSYLELGVGTDGTPDERRRLQDQVRIALGTIGVEVELTKQQLDECVDNALLMVRKYSSYSYQHSFFFLDVFPNQQKYSLTSKCVGFNKIISVNAGHRMRSGFLGASQGGFGGGDIFGYAALQQMYRLGTFDMLSYHLVSSYMEDLRMIFADQLVFDFYEDTRTLNFHQVFYANERVLLDCHIELPEQKLINNRYLALWIKKWAISEAKMILSQVRGKYQSLPGPNGSTVLNSQELITQAENEKSELREELFDRSMQDHNSDVQSQFFIG